jgi:hypothetical protein
MGSPRTEFGHSQSCIASAALRLRQEFLEWLPVIFVPAIEEALGVAVGKSFVVQGEFGSRAAIREFKLHDGVGAGVPVHRTPGLDDSLTGDQLDLPTCDEATEHGERAAGFRADLCGRCSSGHARFDSVAEFDNALKLFCVGESIVNALGTGCEGDFLMNGFGGVRDGVIGACSSRGWPQDKCAKGDCSAG